MRFAYLSLVYSFLFAIFSPLSFGVVMDHAFTQIPSRFHSRVLTSGARAIGETCYSRALMPDGSACTAAGMTATTANSLMAQTFIGNGYAAVNTVDKFLFKPISREFLRDLFQKNNQTSLEGQIGLAFTSRYFSAGFSPYRVQYASEVHNPNFPVVAVHASLERNLIFAGALPLTIISPNFEALSFGLRMRLIERKYVHNTFSLFQAMNEEPRSLVPVREQKGVFFEPSLGWEIPAGDGKVFLSSEVKNIGTTWPAEDLHGKALHQDATDLGVGGGIVIPLSLGNFKAGLDMVDLFTAANFLARPRFGVSYQIGMVEWMAGVHRYLLSTGLQFSFQVVQVGIVYEAIRSDLKGTNPGSRIATEFAIRL